MITQEFEISEKLKREFKDIVFCRQAIEMAEVGLLEQRANVLKRQSKCWEDVCEELKIDPKIKLSYLDGKVIAKDDADEPPKA